MPPRFFVAATVLAMLSTSAIAAPAAHAAPVRAELPAVPQEEVNAGEFTLARTKSRAAVDSASDRSALADFLREAAEEANIYYDHNEVEVVDVTSDLEMVLPTDADVHRVAVSPIENGAGLELESDVVGGDGIDQVAGPGSGWDSKGFGTYKISVNGWGAGNFTYQKYKFGGGDGESNRDIWAYQRKAMATPTVIPLAPDARVQKLYIRNYPTQSTYPKLVAWMGRSPGKDFDGDCNTSPFKPYVEYKGVGLSMEFIDCDHYDVAVNEDIPGEYRIEFDQGQAVTRTGSQEVGYSVTFSVKQGQEPYFRDHQKIVFFKQGKGATCESIDTGKTC